MKSNMKMKLKEYQQIQDPETEAKELENILRDVGLSIAQSCTRPGKSGLTFEQFKANFLKTVAKTAIPAHGPH